MSDDERVTISITVEALSDLKIADVWPDGDAPNEVTADAVRELMESSGHAQRVLDDWGLLNNLDVTIVVSRPNPAWKQNMSLIGDPPRRFLIEVARPWDPFARSTSAIESDG